MQVRPRLESEPIGIADIDCCIKQLFSLFQCYERPQNSRHTILLTLLWSDLERNMV